MYEDHLAKVRHLLKTVCDYVNSKEIYPRHHVYLDAVLLALLSKLIRVGEAACLLVENGFDDEAYGLSRTMVEIALSVRYLVNTDRFRRSERYVKYFAKDHEGWTRIIPKYYPTLSVRYHPQHSEMLDIARTFKSPHSWRDGQIRDAAIELDTIERDDKGNPTNWEFDYEVIYKWTSHFVHGTVVALDAHAMGPGEAFRVNGGQQRIPKGGMALFNVAIYLFKGVVLVFRGVQHDISKEVLDQFETRIKELAKQRYRPD